MRYRPRRPLSTILLTVGLLVFTMAGPLASASAADDITLPQVSSGFRSPTQVTNAGDGTNRLFVVERRGTIKAIANNGTGAVTTFLNIPGLVDDTSGERGLLGLAFHPNFETNHRFFVYYTRAGGDIVLARYRANGDNSAAIPDSGQKLLVIEHSANTNHNGGALAFGPNDGLLYIGTGDGGGSGDPANNAQNKNSLLGKVLRINVDRTGSGPYGRYRIPSSNPFAGSTPGKGEIWAYGLRNPWRISFDRISGRLFIADVGQNRYEEINRENKFSRGGKNYGWDRMEGKHCFSRCPLAGDTLPIVEYTHAGGNCSITGGYVYRGTLNASLIGKYVYADFCSGRFWSVPWNDVVATQRKNADSGLLITSFGEGEGGELYVVTIGGRLLQVRAP
jgi:glucose/arabinose dehydrogenase